jgi:hypothetical protein
MGDAGVLYRAVAPAPLSACEACRSVVADSTYSALVPLPVLLTARHAWRSYRGRTIHTDLGLNRS